LDNFRQEFIAFAVRQGVLRFGEFTTKAGRVSPYFFNAGLFNSGASLGALARYYARTLQAAQRDGLVYDMLFGPAYKGITLASATAVALSTEGADVPFAYNRKEAKDHGEGGVLVGAPLKGRVVIVDDVISAGTSVRESVDIIRAAGATPAAVLLALDRMERGGNATEVRAMSAVQEVRAEFGIPVLAIATLDDLMDYLASTGAAGGHQTESGPAQALHARRVSDYRVRYGI
jgi:orotate phosphoribosyltransferase